MFGSNGLWSGGRTSLGRKALIKTPEVEKIILSHVKFAGYYIRSSSRFLVFPFY